MKIKNYTLDTGANEYELELEISDIHCENDSIGWYEYGSAKEYDHQKSYVGEFKINEIIVDGMKVEGVTFEVFENILMEDETLIKRIEKELKEEAESDKIERKLSTRED
jgi:hypothetical protein